MRNLRFLSLLFAILLGPSYAQGQARWEHLTEQDGLVAAVANSITQDSFGFIWIGTWDGVSRYDGKHVRSFSLIPLDTLSLASSDGRYVVADDLGGVWVAVQGNGLDYFDPNLDGFRHYGENKGLGGVRFDRPLVSPDGTVYAYSENGLKKLNAESDQFEPVPDWNHDAWGEIKATGDGSLYFRYTPFGGESNSQMLGTWKPDGTLISEEIPTKIDRSGTRIQLVKTDDLEWIVGSSEGIVVQRKNEGWDHLAFVPNVCTDDLGGMVVTGAGSLWTQNGEAICQIDLINRTVDVYSHDPTNPHSILPATPNNSGLFVDRQGLIWVTRFGYGVSRMDPQATQFDVIGRGEGLPKGGVMAALENEDGSVWIGLREESPTTLIRREPSGQWTSFASATDRGSGPGVKKSNGMSHPFVWDLAKTADGSIWTANTSPGEGGLNRVIPATGEVYQFGNDPSDERSLPTSMVVALEVDGSDAVWVGFWGEGLARVDPKDNSVQRIFLPPGGISPTEVQADVQSFARANNGNIWVGTRWRNGLFQIDHETLELTSYTVPRPGSTNSEFGMGYVQALHEDRLGRLWIGTEFFGFGQYDPATQTMVSRYTAESLNIPSAAVSAIQSDDLGRLWLATMNGIVRFDPETERAVHYGYDSGLTGLRFQNTADYRGPSGKIYFSLPASLVVIDPSTVSENAIAPDVVFSGIKIDGKTVSVDSTGVIDKPITLATRVRLDPDVSVLELEFAALHFSNPAGNRFRFQLVGFDDDWREGGTLGSATYTNLPIGTFEFQVKAASRDAVWSAPISITVQVLPPWWRTVWAYMSYVILVGGVIWVGGRAQRARVAQQERNRVREKELAQAQKIERQHEELTQAYGALESSHAELKNTQAQLIEQEKLASLGSLTAGIAHEIKNPLNFVNNFAEVGAEMADELSEAIAAGNSEEAQAIIAELRENAKQITKHGRRADDIVKAMMQHARGGASEREEVQLNTFLEEYANLAWHGMRAKDNDFQAELKRDFDPLVGSVKVMPQELGRVVLNLLNNAFDAVRGIDGARVTIATRATDRHVSISVSDNGPGIPDSIRDKIFEPFFTTKATGEGTGLGLSLSYDIVTKGHGGTMTVGESSQGGAEFTVILPQE